jgi:hypothetical protein
MILFLFSRGAVTVNYVHARRYELFSNFYVNDGHHVTCSWNKKCKWIGVATIISLRFGKFICFSLLETFRIFEKKKKYLKYDRNMIKFVSNLIAKCSR